VVAARTASNARREESTRAQRSVLASAPTAAIDPDIALLQRKYGAVLQRKYGAVFEAALREAFTQLDAEERSALKLSYAEGLNLEGVARALGISRATAGRRVLSGREKVREATLSLLQVRIQATPRRVCSTWCAASSSSAWAALRHRGAESFELGAASRARSHFQDAGSPPLPDPLPGGGEREPFRSSRSVTRDGSTWCVGRFRSGT
jgi:predicted DNA-binding protein (UPF0251 family)